MIDSHCHLTDTKFAPDMDSVLERAKGAGLTHIMTIADSLKESEQAVALAQKYDRLWCTVGVHPHNAKEWGEGSAEKLRECVQRSAKVLAIGEIGLDYHYDFSPREAQREVFRAQLELAKSIDLPVIVHCREAVTDVRALVSELRPAKMVLHCCTETWEDAEWFVAQGYLLSFTGIATYPNAADIRRTIEMCPLSQLMIETDAPYLAPIPHRGKRNEPAFVVEVAKAVAGIKGLSLEEVDRATSANAVAFFGLPQ